VSLFQFVPDAVILSNAKDLLVSYFQNSQLYRRIKETYGLE
jgi:hypothetical protein